MARSDRGVVGAVLDALPSEALFALRHALFLGPLGAAAVLVRRRRAERRVLVGALFSLLYGLSLIFVTHVAAMRLGWWSYGGEVLELHGMPADIWFGGALLWGPVLFLAFPRVSPWLLIAPFVLLNGLLLPSLTPFVSAGEGWFAGVVLVFLSAHLPALYLARWTAGDIRLPWRAFLLAMGYGGFAFVALPTVIMHAMGGDWSVLLARPAWMLTLAGGLMLALCVLGLSAVQMFALHGGGTPIPLDSTKRLVRTGVYAYLTNPMQLSTAAGWLVTGAALGSVWVAAAAAMAVCFVLGLVRWHHRQDLEVRFPDGWPEYRSRVPEWLPSWRPSIFAPAQFRFDPRVSWQRRAAAALSWLGPRGLDVVTAPGPLTYREPEEATEFRGVAAVAKALNHTNFVLALAGAGLLLIVLPLGATLRICGVPARRLRTASGD